MEGHSSRFAYPNILYNIDIDIVLILYTFESKISRLFVMYIMDIKDIGMET